MSPTRRRSPRPPTAGRSLAPVRVDLALQGGGSHGAFTWGVLDRLLEDETLEFDGVSGTSAGALNAAVLATGLAEGGREGARAALRAFWHEVAGVRGCFGHPDAAAADAGAGPTPAPMSAPMSAPASPPAPDTAAARGGPAWKDWPAWAGWPVWSGWSGWSGWPGLPTWPGLPAPQLEWHPAYLWFRELTRTLSPYQFNPFDINPLREVVRRHVRPAALARAPLRLFVTATAVRTGRPRVFDRGALTIDALLASACLPQLFRAVPIDGEPYWDGGYSGNPALWPLIYHTDALDLVLVKVNPLVRPALPDTAAEIADRVNEITFNASLIGEMRAIGFVHKLFEEGRLDPGAYKNLRLHMVAEEVALGRLHPSSKMNTQLAFLLELHALGRATAHAWWHENRRHLGRRSTLDLRRTFLETHPVPEAPAGPAPDAASDRGRRPAARGPRRRAAR